MAALACPAARRHFDALLDDRLVPALRSRLRAHLRACPDCGPAYAALDGLRAGLRALPSEPLPPGFAARLHRRLAAAAPAPRPARWRGAALPLATAVAGFLAAAALARPVLAPGGAVQGGPAALVAMQQPAQPAPIGAVTPALFPKAAANAAYGAAAVAAPTGLPGASSTAQAVSPAAAPAAAALTLLAPEPGLAVQTLSDFAVAGGGHVITTFLGPAAGGAAAAGAPQAVATVDAVIPGGSIAAYSAQAGTVGTVLAQVADPPAQATGPVRLIVTVLQGPALQAGPSAAAGARAGAASSGGGWAGQVLLAAGRAAPWGAAAAGVALLASLGAALVRRARH